MLIHYRTERNATGWSKNLLESILVDLLIEGEAGDVAKLCCATIALL